MPSLYFCVATVQSGGNLATGFAEVNNSGQLTVNGRVGGDLTGNNNSVTTVTGTVVGNTGLTGSSNLTVTGTANLQAGLGCLTGQINLNNTTNDFSGTVTASATPIAAPT